MSCYPVCHPQVKAERGVVHSRTLADILRSWRSSVPRALFSSDFRFARYFLTKEREVGFGFVLGLRSQAEPTDRAPYFWETKPQIRVVMLSKCVRGWCCCESESGCCRRD